MEFSFIRHLILCEMLISPVLGILATCLSPAVLRGETAAINCSFDADINALHKDFQVDRYSLDPSHTFEETVLFCYWTDGVRSCKTANEYEYDECVVDQFNIKVPNAMAKHAGRYACQTVPSEPGEIQPCYLYIIEPPEVDQTVLIVVSGIVGLAIGVLILSVSFALYHINGIIEWLKRKFNISQDVPGIVKYKQTPPTTPAPSDDQEKSQQMNRLLRPPTY